MADDLDAARLLIDARRVLVSGTTADNASRQVGPDEPVRLEPAPARFVGRGGEKLDAALDRFGVVVRGRRVLDAGASTGGFSDCVLQRAAATVVAADVGYGQLHERVSGDARVTVLDRTNVRHLDLDAIGGPVDVVVADLSFISLRTVAGALLGLAAPGADLVLLVKPQFEAAKVEVDRGRGIIVDPAIWERSLLAVIAAFTDLGATIMGVMTSPITGTDGNVEFLLHAVAGPAPASAVEVDPAGAARIGALVDRAIHDATAR